jgi:hypothetical protein
MRAGDEIKWSFIAICFIARLISGNADALVVVVVLLGDGRR